MTTSETTSSSSNGPAWDSSQGIYRRRLTSSLYAFKQSLKARQETLEGRRGIFFDD